MQNVRVGEVSDVELVKIIQRFKCNDGKMDSIPAGVLMMIAAYAQPWYDNVFRFGGWDGHEELSSSIRFDVKENMWIKLADMNYPRFCATTALHSPTSQIFVCGGYDNGQSLPVMERYSIVSDKWMTMPSMKHSRFGHTSVEWNGSIFVIGGYASGYNGHQNLSSCEIFNIASNTWSDLPNMNTARYFHSSVVVVNNHSCRNGAAHIYAIGGEVEKSAERYDIASKKWSQIASLSEWRYRHGNVVLRTTPTDVTDAADVIDTTILVIGGFRTREGATSSVEQYSVNGNKWITLLWKLPEPRHTFSIHMLSDNHLLLCGGDSGIIYTRSCLHIDLNSSIIK